MAICPTIQVIREDHPDKVVTINLADLSPDDVVYTGENHGDEPKPKRKYTKRGQVDGDDNG